jgi:hypothetical protein
MTRESVKTILTNAQRADDCRCVDGVIAFILVGKIFDHFEAQLQQLESRSCDGCKYANATYIPDIKNFCLNCTRNMIEHKDHYTPKENK